MTKTLLKPIIQIFLLTISLNCISQNDGRFTANGKWGYKVGTTIIIEAKFDTIHNFFSGIARTELDNNYGAINEAGEEVIPCIYSQCSYFGRVWMTVKKDEKWGVLTREGEEVIPVKYEAIGEHTDYKYISVKLNGMWGLVNLKDKTIIPFEYAHKFYGHQGLFAVSQRGWYGFVNKKNEIVIPFHYTDAYNFYNNIAEVYLDTLVGFIDRENKIIIPIRFESVLEMDNDLIAVFENGRYGIWTVKGKEIIEPKYTDFIELYSDYKGVIMIDSCGSYLFDLNGNLLINEPCTAIEESHFNDEWLDFTKNGKRGIYDLENQEFVIDAKYDRFEEYEYDLLLVFNNDKQGLFQISEKTILIEPVFDEFESINSELYIVKNDNFFGVIRTDGTYLLKMEYTAIWMEDNKMLGARLNDEEVFYNLKGERINID